MKVVLQYTRNMQAMAKLPNPGARPPTAGIAAASSSRSFPSRPGPHGLQVAHPASLAHDDAAGFEQHSSAPSSIPAPFIPETVADVEAVRRLAPLPETADELRAIAKTLGVGDEALFLGQNATETRVREVDLSDTRVIAFATHGLVAGEIAGAA